jgi:23S rRNA pseudouridine2457 synthase
MHRYFVVYKPYRMISQFISPYPSQRLLRDLEFRFPEGTHAVGRLDEKSEGLLILTTDKSVTRRLLHPSKEHIRKYLVHVQREVSEQSLKQLQDGISILLKKVGNYTTQPCGVKLLEAAPALAEREDAYKEYFPHTWLEFVLTEGKNRQIRKMCEAVKHRVKRLVRTHIEDLSIEGFLPGEVREINKQELFRLLKLDRP